MSKFSQTLRPIAWFLPIASLLILLGLILLCDQYIFGTRLILGSRAGGDPNPEELEWIVRQHTTVWKIPDIGGRAVWGILGVAQVLACLATIAFSLSIIGRRCSIPLAVIGVVVLIAWVARWIYCAVQLPPSDFPGNIIRHALTKVGQSQVGVEVALAIGNSLAYAVVASAAIAIACLSHFRTTNDATGDSSGRAHDLRMLLTLSSATMTAAVFQIGAQYEWPVALVKHESSSELFLHNWAVKIAFVNGLLYSLQMIALFVPAAYLLQEHVREQNALGVGAVTTVAKTEPMGIDVSPSQMLLDVSKIIWPMLAALPFSIFKA